MAEKINDGGPAYPQNELDQFTGGVYLQHMGLTMRDWFAGQALSSIPLRRWDTDGVSDAVIIEKWARCAYAVADAMLSTRSSNMRAEE